MVKSVARKVMWLGRATTFMVGLAVVLALSVGVASSALAGTGVGATFDLGQTNTVSAVSKLVGSIAGANLVIDNNSTGTGATALELQVEAGEAPMKVNSGAKVANVNSDKLDGLDSTAFTPKTYEVEELITMLAGTNFFSHELSCDPGDLALSGGFSGLDSASLLIESSNRFDGNESMWAFKFKSNGTTNAGLIVSATCADFGAAHQ